MMANTLALAGLVGLFAGAGLSGWYVFRAESMVELILKGPVVMFAGMALILVAAWVSQHG
jgi:hypothetical protein